MLNELVSKRALKKHIEQLIGKEGVRKALKDPHTRRKPRPCGFTIHTGIGCSLKCIYCYIEDMGFQWSIREYPLTGLELVYSLLSNPYFVPGERGSLLAIGSVTEPFHGVTRRKTMEYIESIYTYLGNPTQFSTKMYITEREAYELARISKSRISPLVTIITIKWAPKLEPLVPPPDKRFETIRNLRRAGLKPFLFLRPVIPGIIEDEYVEILENAHKYGAEGVVIGSLRVTKTIIERLAKIGVPVEEIMYRLPRKPRGNEQISIDTRDIKQEIMKYARKIGLIAFPEACLANMYTHGFTCWKMLRSGISSGISPPKPNVNEIRDVAEKLGLDVNGIKFDGINLTLYVNDIRRNNSKLILLQEILHARYRACIRIKKI